jgi:hypothetical protein
MKNVRSLLLTLAMLGIGLLGIGLIGACDGDDDDSATGRDAGVSSYVCDPATATPRGMLLNAPLDPGVQVIQKTPTHPGDPGPDGLP